MPRGWNGKHLSRSTTPLQRLRRQNRLLSMPSWAEWRPRRLSYPKSRLGFGHCKQSQFLCSASCDEWRNPMTSSSPTLSDMQRAVRDTVRLHWQLFLAQGVIMLILGVLAIIWPGISTIAVDIYVGWLFLLSGIVGIFTMFLARDVQAFLWMLLTAALSFFVGVILLWHPVEGAVSLTLVLIAFFIVEGAFQVVASLSY